jgi:folate-binding protein YgfZ
MRKRAADSSAGCSARAAAIIELQEQRAMTAELRPEEGAFFDLSARTKLRVAGTDRVRFLNGQISNDLRKATSGTAIHACVLNAKGRINGDLFIVAEGDSFLLDADAEMRETLPARLERYVIADDVEISDVTEEFALFHTIGGVRDAGLANARVVLAERFEMAGADLWLPRTTHEVAMQQLNSRVPFCDEACAEVFRIERGVPRWGRELTDEIIPTEANLEAQAIDYSKGCYIGQEVISRMKMSGQTNKRLCGLIGAADERLSAGMRLVAADGKDVGAVTSAAISGRVGRAIALGFVKRGYNAVGTELHAVRSEMASADPAVAVKVVALPFF